MRLTLTLQILLLGSAAAAADPAGGRAPSLIIPPEIRSETVDHVIAKAMRWLAGHPASVRRKEHMEVVEEIMFFYALHAAAGQEAERARFLGEMTARHRAIEAFIADNVDLQQHLQGDWAVLTYPPLAHIISRMGLEIDAYRVLIDGLVSRKQHLASPRHAIQLWAAVYLERLDYVPETEVQYLLGVSSLQQDPETHVLLDHFIDPAVAGRDPQATIQLVYNITHEIIALTDFGVLAPPPVMTAQRGHYIRLVDAAMVWATRQSALDALAELVFCSHLLDIRDLPALPAALALIISKQQADGSFGITNPDRPNGVRHGVLTALLALKTLDQARQP